jgi:hypothetical protein
MSEFEIRRLGATDVPVYQALFLEALRSAPSAFAADYEQESVRSLEEVGERLRREATYGAFVEGSLGGIETFQQQITPKRRHVGMVWNMHVAEERAWKFYKRFGFESYGVMPRALRVDGTDYDALMMTRKFR